MSSWYDTGMAYDKANQLVTSTTPDGKVTKYAYDAAGRMVKEGKRTCRYGYLDKVISVTEGKERITYGYHVDGQLATVTKGKVTENFTWDGLALVKRGITSYLNEPHPGGGAPVTSSNGGSTMPRCEGRGFQSRSSWRRSPPQPRPPRGTCRCTQVAAPRTRAYAHAVLILGLDINTGIVFSLPSFLSFASFLSFLRFLFCPCRAPFFWLCTTRPRHPPQTKSGYKKSASFPTRLRLGFGVVVLWIFPWFVT